MSLNFLIERIYYKIIENIPILEHNILWLNYYFYTLLTITILFSFFFLIIVLDKKSELGYFFLKKQAELQWLKKILVSYIIIVMIVPFVLATNHPKTFKELVIFILTNSSWFLPKINLFIVFSLFGYLFLECFIKDWIRVIRIKESNLTIKTYSLMKLKSWGIFLFQPFYWCFLFPLFVLMQYGYIFFDRLIFSIIGFTIFLIFQHVRHTILSYNGVCLLAITLSYIVLLLVILYFYCYYRNKISLSFINYCFFKNKTFKKILLNKNLELFPYFLQNSLVNQFFVFAIFLLLIFGIFAEELFLTPLETNEPIIENYKSTYNYIVDIIHYFFVVDESKTLVDSSGSILTNEEVKDFLNNSINQFERTHKLK